MATAKVCHAHPLQSLILTPLDFMMGGYPGVRNPVLLGMLGPLLLRA